MRKRGRTALLLTAGAGVVTGGESRCLSEAFPPFFALPALSSNQVSSTGVHSQINWRGDYLSPCKCSSADYWRPPDGKELKKERLSTEGRTIARVLVSLTAPESGRNAGAAERVDDALRS